MTQGAYMASVGEWIREQRTSLGLKQAAVADAVHVTEATMSRWEAGLMMLSSHSHAKLEAFFRRERLLAEQQKVSA